MAKIINPKDLKQSTTKVIKDVNPTVQSTDNSDVNVNALLTRLNELENLVKTTWNQNKIKDYENAKTKMKWFSFSLKLFPTDNWDFPVISWKTVYNYVARNDDDKTVQQIEIIYLKDWKENKKKIDLVDFVRVLKRTDLIMATSITNLDWSEVYIDEKINAEEDTAFYIIKPKGDIFNATINYEWAEITILSTYLNA